MDLDRLHAILRDATIQIREGEIVHGDAPLVEAIGRGDEELPGGSVTFDMMPADREVRGDLARIDLHFLKIGVDKAKAAEHKTELAEILRTYPDPATLRGGPSYITVGAEIGDQGAAFQLFALGKVCGFWDVITPKTLGITGEEADQMAGMGYVMITGFR